jgi:hypothetical protein
MTDVELHRIFLVKEVKKTFMNISGTILLESKIQPETLYQKQQVSRQNLLFICIFKCFSE